MTASLYENRLAFNYRTTPWHGLGTEIQDDISVIDAVGVSRTDYPVYLAAPHGYNIVDGGYVSPDNIHGDSTNNGIAVLRGPSYDDDKYYVLGKASDRFTLVQNIDLAKMVEPLRKWGRVETVGALDYGARFFITFEGASWSFMVNGKEDVQQMFLIIKNTHLPGECLQFQISNTRVVCRNTWEMAENNALMNLPLAHTADIAMITQWVVNVLESLPEKRDQMKLAAEHMAATPVDDQTVKLGIAKAIPMPASHKVSQILKEQKAINLPPELEMVAADIDALIERKDRDASVAQVRIQAMRDAAWRTYQESDTVARGTAWGAFNAVTETVDHVVRSATATRQTTKAAASNFWGERSGWKLNAFKFFSELNNN